MITKIDCKCSNVKNKKQDDRVFKRLEMFMLGPNLFWDNPIRKLCTRKWQPISSLLLIQRMFHCFSSMDRHNSSRYEVSPDGS